MELFIPSLLTLLILGFIVYGVLPRATVPVILTVSVLILCFVLYNHYFAFNYEYRYSTWQEIFKQYSSFIMVGILIVFIIIAAVTTFKSGLGSSSPTIPSAVPLPSANTATNPVTSALNTAIRNVSNSVESAINTVSNSFSGNNRKNYNLSPLVTTPK
jgi:hypothetical protein